jgi:hypothetical protein
MEEGNWIGMPGVPLITAEGVAVERGAAADMGAVGPTRSATTPSLLKRW